MEPQASVVEIQHDQHDDHRGVFFVQKETRRVAELTYRMTSPQTMVIEHTEVSAAVRGGGVGRLLVEAAVKWARRTGTKIVPECANAKTVFERYPDLRDVLK